MLLQALAEAPATQLVDTRGTELLSKREQDVVRWLAEGHTNNQIAGELQISENTVKNYLFRIFDKLGVSSRVEVVLYAANQSSSVHSSVQWMKPEGLVRDPQRPAVAFPSASVFVSTVTAANNLA
jgi:DNA-binding CsgD family transcriptional regulator